ncbi:putative ABC transporter permease [Atopobium sp. oral taxon 199]|uniref:putative ABC transporter permease n=1 Tax=Atopobium sp. oral taxon 199 TaxID=712156 RepID=UPI00034ECE16|nr:putative ABC transporter permease [Atopobium sp. oral taxon 199]EPD77850.1 hypothetical protein HMPREF1527_00151 [Atopobium sp. oral taxon 199 str. F0494]
MLFILASLIALIFVAWLVVRGFANAFYFFARWLSGGEKLDAETTLSVSGKLHSTKKEREQYLDVLHIGWYQVVILFVGGSMAGLLLEEIWMLVTAGLTESRVGLVWGPFSPLYGTGTVLLTVICYWLRRRHVSNLVVFLVSACIGGILEQVTGWGMLTFFHTQSWSYAHLPDHITEFVAWRFLFFWGLLGLAWCRFVMPRALYHIGEPTSRRQAIFITLISVYVVADVCMTVACFTRATARDAGVSPHNAFEEWVDTHYSNEFISARFQNMSVHVEGTK